MTNETEQAASDLLRQFLGLLRELDAEKVEETDFRTVLHDEIDDANDESIPALIAHQLVEIASELKLLHLTLKAESGARTFFGRGQSPQEGAP